MRKTRALLAAVAFGSLATATSTLAQDMSDVVVFRRQISEPVAKPAPVPTPTPSPIGTPTPTPTPNPTPTPIPNQPQPAGTTATPAKTAADGSGRMVAWLFTAPQSAGPACDDRAPAVSEVTCHVYGTWERLPDAACGSDRPGPFTTIEHSACKPQWEIGTWSVPEQAACNIVTERVRTVDCKIYPANESAGHLHRVDDALCPAPVPVGRETVQDGTQCKGTWTPTPWIDAPGYYCSKGEQILDRDVSCMANGMTLPESECSTALWPGTMGKRSCARSCHTPEAGKYAQFRPGQSISDRKVLGTVTREAGYLSRARRLCEAEPNATICGVYWSEGATTMTVSAWYNSTYTTLANDSREGTGTPTQRYFGSTCGPS